MISGSEEPGRTAGLEMSPCRAVPKIRATLSRTCLDGGLPNCLETPRGIRSRTGTEGLGMGSLVAGASEEAPVTSCRKRVSGLSNRVSPG